MTALALLAGWAQWQLVDTQRWGDTGQEILQREPVRRRIAEYIVQEVRRSAGGTLPPQLRALEPAVERELGSERSARAWRIATTEAHRELVRVIDTGGSGPGDVVVLDLHRLLRSVARDLRLPPPHISASAARITIVAGDQIRGARQAAHRLERIALLLSIAAPLTFALALATARGWRLRALAGVGLAVAGAGVLVLLTRALVGANVVDVLAASARDRDAVAAAWSAGTSSLAQMAVIAIAAGLAVALAAGVAARPRRERYL
jgi:hypothetical protein